MKFIFICTVFLLSTVFGFSQYAIKGVVLNAKDQQAVGFATIVASKIDPTTTTRKYVGIANDQGVFVLDNIEEGKYLIQVSMIGFDAFQQEIQISSTADMGQIYITPNTTELNEAVVTAKKTAVINLADKMIVNFGSYMQVGGKNSLDAFRILPGVLVDQGSISLMGKGVTVYINGRPSRMDGSELTNYLRSLQADQIESVELISNPSARYEAGNSNAIINIQLKKDGSLGINGSVGLSFGTFDNNTNFIPNINLNYRTLKTNIYGSYVYMYNRFNNDMETTRKYHDASSQYDEKGQSQGRVNYHNYALGIDHYLNKKQSLGFLFKSTQNNFTQNNPSETKIHQITNPVIDSVIISPIDMLTNSGVYQFNLNHNWLIDTFGTSWNTDFTYMFVNNKNDQFVPITYFDASGNLLHPATGHGQKTNQDMQFWTIQSYLDYQAIPNGALELGFKYDHVQRNNVLHSFENKNDTWVEQLNNSNTYDYKEAIYAVYTDFTYTIKQLNISAGLRAEQTVQKGNEHSEQNRFNKNYFQLFPSVSLLYKLKNDYAIAASYAKKVNRPSFTMLNPFKFYTSPQTFQEGNPELAANLLDSYSLKLSRKAMGVNFQYLYDNGNFVQEVQSDNDHVIGYRYINFGSSKQFLAAGYFSVNITNWWKMNVNATLSHTQLRSQLGGDIFLQKYWRLNGNTNHTFTFTKQLTGNLYVGAGTSRWYSATKIKPSGYMQMSIQQSFLSDKLQVSLFLNDPFRWATFQSDYRYQNIEIHTREVLNTRSLGVTLNYSFGSNKIKSARARTTGAENVQSRN